MKKILKVLEYVSALALVLTIGVGSWMGTAANLPWYAWLMWAVMLLCDGVFAVASIVLSDLVDAVNDYDVDHR